MIKYQLAFTIVFLALLSILVFRNNGDLADYKRIRSDNTEQLETLLNNMIGSKSCSSCKSALPIIKRLNKNRFTRKLLYKIIIRKCKKYYYNDEGLCNGILELFGTWYLDVLSKINLNQKGGPDLTRLMCYTLNKVCPVPELPEPDLHLPKLSLYKVKKNKLIDDMKIFHFSDLHLDLKYLPNSEAKCNLPICCRQFRNRIKRPANYWGDYNCDTSFMLLVSMIKEIKSKINKETDIIIFTGDLLPHDIWNQDKARFQVGLNKTFIYLQQELKDYMFFPAIGNHESVPVNSFPLRFMVDKPHWSYKVLADKWQPWLEKTQLKQVRKIGSYSQVVNKRFKMISINTNMCNCLNFYLPLMFDKQINPNPTQYDPDGVLQWLINELQDAYDQEHDAILIGHIAPGDPDCFHFWTMAYNKIIQHYSKIIKGQYFGHTHLDHFELFYDENKLANQIAFIAPSVTPFIGSNPSFRVYDYNTRFHLIDHRTLIADLSKAKSWKRNAKWSLEYNAKGTYFNDSNEINPEKWQALTSKFLANDTLFGRFYSFLHRVHKSNFTDQSRKNWICLLRSSINNDECNPDPPIDRH